MPATLNFNGQLYILDVKKTLLENLETQSVSIEYHCREGHCGACRSTLISGEVFYNDFPMAYLRDNEVLLCCSRAKEDIIVSCS